ncbi:AAA family ATPase [Magnetofaba australis]|uniref:DNA primase/polymerase bifunctional N-terminal domain-containing protein n=1 Tax=Magnetofaba australis IT-1 TaxID=1434232 RepID=A0A1Y2K5B5_9PROT|nr:AAA family ATPase [Magnetofaba australis]OSM04163.1 hypothetical protein MAIT1_04013 [Magnetofaba australis IT-1]
MNATISPFASVAANYWEHGIPVLPIIPGTKRPGFFDSDRQRWEGLRKWQQYCAQMPTEEQIVPWLDWPEAGICIPLGKASGIIALDRDTERPDIVAALDRIIPLSPCAKRGKKGWTAFYRYNGERPHRWKLSRDSAPVLELLSHGTQTVIPPTIHPDTGMAYDWVSPDTLLDVALDELPILPADFVSCVEEALNPFRVPEERVAATIPSHVEVDADDPFQSINGIALSNLDTWVPKLITDAHRTPDGAYRCVAFWRGGDGLNVGITAEGIRDWARGTGMTPIDLVMAVTNQSAGQALTWLQHTMGVAPPVQEQLVWEDEATTESASEDDNGPFFSYGEITGNPPPKPESFWREAAFFRGARVLIAGGPKIGKSNFFLNLAMQASVGGAFLGDRFTAPLRTMWVQAEIHKSFLMPRLERYARHMTPAEIALLKANFILTGRLSWDLTNYRDLVKLHKGVDQHRPDILCLDPVINFSTANENDNVEVKKLLTNVETIGEMYGCMVVLLHHTNKSVPTNDPFNSIRGASAFRGWFDTGILLTGRPDELTVSYELRNAKSPAAHGCQFDDRTGEYVAVLDDEFELEEQHEEMDEGLLQSAYQILAGHPDGLTYSAFLETIKAVMQLGKNRAKKVITELRDRGLASTHGDWKKVIYRAELIQGVEK